MRVTDADGMRLRCFATSTVDRPIAELELRHRLRARAEDRIRAARATGLRNLPLHDTAQNQVWLEIVQMAFDLLAWMPMLALTGQARFWEPRRLRFRLFSVAGQLVTTGRRRLLRLARHWPWTREITDALERLALLPNPGRPTAFPPLRAASPSPGAVEPGVHPRRHPGPRPAHSRPSATK